LARYNYSKELGENKKVTRTEYHATFHVFQTFRIIIVVIDDDDVAQNAIVTTTTATTNSDKNRNGDDSTAGGTEWCASTG
jgi:hypothetical protein